MDKIDLISSFAWFGRYPEVKITNSCIQLLSKRQVLKMQNILCYSRLLNHLTAKSARCKLQDTCVIDHLTMTFLARTLNKVARYLT